MTLKINEIKDEKGFTKQINLNIDLSVDFESLIKLESALDFSYATECFFTKSWTEQMKTNNGFALKTRFIKELRDNLRQEIIKLMPEKSFKD